MSGLEKEFPGQVVSKNLDATTPEATKVIKELGFGTHGLVVRSPRGDVLYKAPDHHVNMDEVKKKIAELLKEGS